MRVCRRSGSKEQGAREQGGSQAPATRRTTQGTDWTTVLLCSPQAGLTGWRINSTHGPERGSLHFNRCGCVGLGAARQCGNASEPEREVRPATIPRPRGGNCTRNSSTNSSSSSTSTSSGGRGCHLPPPTSTTPTATSPPPPPPRPSPTPIPTTTPTVPTAGSHDPR